ncbi:Esterase/lipase/thioesterase [Rhizophlyctis rosea]|uniref:lytic cellulose monooxygenase (C4-dehydrogenating) n=1 Tax=Rhizophlyctis rosea TaxID=64517 RepID=A0AAD5SCC3_9FUNG|nr:Esterase/lipase/thioesterase [Rhizophlyctis rosea]
MKFAIAAFALANVAGVLGHGYVSEAVIDGVKYPGYNPYADPYYNPPLQRIFRKIPGNGPVEDVTSIDMQCNGWSAGGVVGSAPAALSAPVTAGSTISLKWTTWAESHKGHVATYLAKCPDSCTNWQPGTQAVWFKIHQQAVLADGTWASVPLEKDVPTTFTIPKSLANGNYIVRHELTGLHAAWTYPGIQFYPSCFQVTVSGGGSATGPAQKVAIPGYLTASSPGVVYDMYKPNAAAGYPIPGPPVWDGSSSGGGSQPTTTVPPPTTTTTTARTTTTTRTSVAPAPTTTTRTTTTTTTTTTRAPQTGAPLYGQCGGRGWTGATTCAQGTCKFSNDYYSQCLP